MHALRALINDPLCPHWLKKDKWDYMVPVNIYTDEMPDDLCVRYGRVMNQLQAVAKAANFLDDARFIRNLQKSMTSVTHKTRLPSSTTRAHHCSHSKA